MRAIVRLLLAAVASLALGLWSAWLSVRSPAPVDTIRLGVWQAWPNAGTSDADPYSRARLARTGEIPLGSGEGLMLLALTDDSEEPLTASCDYTIAGQTPPARLWTVAIEDQDGHSIGMRDGVAALASDTLLRANDGAFRVSLSPRPRGGNWISTEEAEQFRIVIRLYDTTARTGTELTTLEMPKITREFCV